MRKDFGNNGGRYDRIIIYNAKWKNCINSQLSDFVDLLELLGVNTNYELLTIESYQSLTTIDPNKTYFIRGE